MVSVVQTTNQTGILNTLNNSQLNTAWPRAIDCNSDCFKDNMVLFGTRERRKPWLQIGLAECDLPYKSSPNSNFNLIGCSLKYPTGLWNSRKWLDWGRIILKKKRLCSVFNLFYFKSISLEFVRKQERVNNGFYFWASATGWLNKHNSKYYPNMNQDTQLRHLMAYVVRQSTDSLLFYVTLGYISWISSGCSAYRKTVVHM